MKPHMQHRLIAFLVLYTGLLTPLRALEIPVADDLFTSAYTGQGSTKYGTHEHLFVNGAVSYNRRSWLKFDLATSSSVLPTWMHWQQVTKAVLRLRVDTVTIAGSIELKAVNAPWQEGILTHNYATSNGLIAGLSDPNVTSFSVAAAQNHDYVDIDVTELVRDWLDGTVTNYGLELNAVGNTSVYFDSKDDAKTGHGPSLHIVLAPARVYPGGDVTMGSFTTIPSGQTVP